MKLKRVIQGVIFLLVLSISVGHTLEESGISVPFLSTASLHAVCPFGGVVSIYEFFISGSYVKKIHESAFVLMFVVLGLTVFLGPVFCGWICPFGTFQEWISRIGKKIFGKKFNNFIPYSIDKYLRYIRYIVLVFVLIKTAQSAQLLFVNIDPYYALFNIWSDEVALSAYIVLLVTVLLSIFIDRPFCKYVCPYGALLGISNIFKPSKISREVSNCISCSLCDKKCPMNIPLSNVKVSKNHQCISCLECTSEAVCPKPDTLTFKMGKRVLTSKHIAIITVTLFVLGVGGSMALNLWKTESSKIPSKYDIGEYTGQNNPGDIRGSYSLKDVEDAFGVPVEILVKAFALNNEDNPENFKIKELEDRYILDQGREIGTDSVRLFVALYKSLPYKSEEGTRLLRPSNLILKDIISGDEMDELNTIIVDIPYNSNIPVIHEEPELSIKGNTTFREVLAMGLSEEDIREVFGELPKNMKISIRDYVKDNGLEFSIIKEKLQNRI